MKKDSLGDRMKKNYEDVHRHILPGHMPTVIRVDGRSFRTVTKGLRKPSNLIEMIFNRVAIAMCKEIATAKMAYLQSDEISFLMHPYQTFETQPFFENNIQKMVSVAASMATFHFLREMENITYGDLEKWFGAGKEAEAVLAAIEEGLREVEILDGKTITFDARAFVLPECEVNNYFYWRQLDTVRNSVSMHAQQRFSPKQLDKKNRLEMIEMMKEQGFDWNNQPANIKHGRCVYKVDGGWVIDNNIPSFKDKPSFVKDFLPHP